MAIDNIHTYYLKFADNYETIMKAWGYCMPGATADAILEKGALTKAPSETCVLDLGCGDGLTGEALLKRGFKDLTAVDFSAPMIKKSQERGCYKSLKQADLLQPLPFEGSQFDLVISTAVTTYLSKKI